jgi:acyl carrier protein
MLLFVERRFAIEIPDSELTHRNLESVDSLARSVMNLLDQGKETTGFSK